MMDLYKTFIDKSVIYLWNDLIPAENWEAKQVANAPDLPKVYAQNSW